MNRVEQKIEQLDKLVLSYAMLNEEYKQKGKRKGTIYYESIKLIKKKVDRLKRELKQLSYDSITSWTIFYEENNIQYRVNFKISSTLTSEEVTSLYQYNYPERLILGLEYIEILLIGIPRS
jgi:hypothetical protein